MGVAWLLEVQPIPCTQWSLLYSQSRLYAKRKKEKKGMRSPLTAVYLSIVDVGTMQMWRAEAVASLHLMVLVVAVVPPVIVVIVPLIMVPVSTS